MSSMHLNSSKHLQNSELIYVNDYKPTLNSISSVNWLNIEIIGFVLMTLYSHFFNNDATASERMSDLSKFPISIRAGNSDARKG